MAVPTAASHCSGDNNESSKGRPASRRDPPDPSPPLRQLPTRTRERQP
eukprot:gene19702-biopygen4034